MFETLFHSARNRLLLAVMLIPFLLRLVLVWQDFPVLIKHSPLLEDDFYYYLNIARSVCDGHGFTADGRTPTTGFQFLHEALCIAVTAPFSPESRYPFRIILSIEVLLSLACLIVLLDMLRTFFGDREALIGGFIFSWWLPVFRHGNNGLETVLQILMILVLVRLCYGVVIRRTPLQLALFGLACGISVLVRIDMLAFPAAFVAVEAIGFLRNKTSAREAGLAIGLVTFFSAAALVGLCLFDYSVNGHLLPDSGIAVKELAVEYIRNFFGGHVLSASPRRALSVLLGDQPYNQLFEVLQIPLHPRLELCGILVIASIYSLVKMRPKPPEAFHWTMGVAVMYSLALVLFYVFYLPAIWYFSRYLFTVAVLSLFILMPFAGELALKVRSRVRPAVFTSLMLLGCVWYMAAGTERWIHFMTDPSEQLSDSELDHRPLSETRVSHIYDIGRWVKFNIPPTMRVAMWQNGLAEYVSRRNILHLDGIVNRYALEAWTNNRLDEYLKDQKVDYLIDFKSFTDIALEHSQHPTEIFTLIGISKSEGPNGTPVALYRVNR